LKPNPNSALHYIVRRSARAKNTRIVVKPDKIEVIAPPHVSERKIKNFVEAQQDWIKAAILRVTEKTHAVPSLAPQHYVDGVSIPFQGQQLPLRIKPSSAKTVRLNLEQEAGFIVSMPVGIEPHQSSELIRQLLTRWMKNQTRHHAGVLIDKHAPRHSLYPRSLKIKTQKSRWGSCGPNNDINLNWLLMLAPPIIMEYVIIHELCHIRHKNHSRDFWQLVAEYMPDYLQHRQWLKQHGASLMKGL